MGPLAKRTALGAQVCAVSESGKENLPSLLSRDEIGPVLQEETCLELHCIDLALRFHYPYGAYALPCTRRFRYTHLFRTPEHLDCSN